MLPELQWRVTAAGTESPFRLPTIDEPRTLVLMIDHASIAGGTELDALMDIGRWSDRVDLRDSADLSPHELDPAQAQHWLWPVALVQLENDASQALSTFTRKEALRLLLVENAAHRHRAHGLVTDATELRTDRRPLANVLTTREALAVVGLHLRTTGETRIGPVDTHSLNPHLGGSVYFFLLREALPAAWRWWSACVAAGGDVQDLASAILDRSNRALIFRDRLHAIALSGQSSEAAIDDQLSYFEFILFLFGGIFDVLAEVADRAYGVNAGRARWQWQKWRDRLRRYDPGLAALMDPGSPHRSVHIIIGALRNTIHGTPVASLTFQSATREQLVAIPQSEETQVRSELAQLGDPDTSWGISEFGGRIHIRPDRFIERLLERVLTAINDLMDATAVERLAPHNWTYAGPPTDHGFSPSTRMRLRLLGGLTEVNARHPHAAPAQLSL
jgi:hypothetical protein